MENTVKISLTKEEDERAQKAIAELNQIFSKYLIALRPDERQSMPKMSDKSYPFVEKVIEYTNSDGQFVPPYLKTESMNVDFNAVQTLNRFYKPLEQMVSNLKDTITKCGSEAYLAALVYYDSVKQAAKSEIPDAKSIYADLKMRFGKRGREKNKVDDITAQG